MIVVPREGKEQTNEICGGRMAQSLNHCCGVFGIIGHSEAARLAYLGLYALQHRGQESAGIAATNGEVWAVAAEPAETVLKASLDVCAAHRHGRGGGRGR